MTKIDALAEQTSFLLEKQQEVQEFFKHEFKSLYDLLGAEQEKSEKANAGEELTSFQNVASMLSAYEKDSIDTLDQDIEFLSEQLVAINQIAQVEDEEKSEELIKMLLDDGYELTDTNRFKADVEQEAEQAKSSFKAMIDDVKATLLEEGIGELELLLEAHKAEMEQQENEEEKDANGIEESDCGSSCHSCSGCNIFEELEVESDEEKDLK